MKFMLLVMGALMLQCSSAGDHTGGAQTRTELNDTWVAIWIQGEDLLSDTLDSSLPVLEINTEENLYSGSDGCNNFKGGISEFDNKTIRFGVSAGTRMMCMEMKIPDLFNKTLGEVVSWKIRDEKLHLFGANGHELMQLKRTG